MQRTAPPRFAPRRAATMLLIATLYAAAAYFLLDFILDLPAGSTGTLTLTFLIVVPTVVSAFLSYFTNPAGTRPFARYLWPPFLLMALIFLIGFAVMREGVICLVLFAPLWTVGALVGAVIGYVLRRRAGRNDGTLCSAILLLPILTVQLETQFPPRIRAESVRRVAVIDAPPGRVWPLLADIRRIGPSEGRWNVAQDLLGIPRPTEAILVADGDRLVRHAQWGPDVSFEEHVTQAVAGRTLRWTFVFPDDSIRDRTDRHIAPDSGHLHILSGGYQLAALADGGTAVELTTEYRLRTPLADYAAWWGDRMLGDIQNNVLAIIKTRAEG